MPFKNFASLTLALFGVEEGITRSFWPDSSPINPKGKKPLVEQSLDVGVISSSS